MYTFKGCRLCRRPPKLKNLRLGWLEDSRLAGWSLAGWRAGWLAGWLAGPRVPGLTY